MSTELASELKVGDSAPDFVFTDEKGQTHRFSEFWGQHHVVVNFLRHFGCIFCREHLVELRKAYPDIRRLGAEVVAVGQGTQQEAEEVCTEVGAKFPCVGDPERVGYRAYGFPLGSVWQVMFSRDARERTREALAKGFSLNRKRSFGKHSNWWQLPGVAIIDRSGVLRFVHRSHSAGDYPPMSVLLDELERLD
jgi:peroxiredoxin